MSVKHIKIGHIKKCCLVFLFSIVSFSFIEKEIESQELYIPPLLDVSVQDGKKIVELEANSAKHRFTSRDVASFAYNDESYLGPTIMYKKGDEVALSVRNNLSFITTFHQHGLIIPDYADGTMYQSIAAKDVWNVEYPILQGAGTFWYHPHRMGETAKQVYYGLAGMIIIEDEQSKALSLPSTYGVNDIPLIIQDKVLDRNGKQQYRANMHTSLMGYIGNTLLVNGKIRPVFSPSQKIIRFRILNASNFGIHTYVFEGVSAYLIANGASFLERPTEISRIMLSSGERIEVLVDFSDSTTQVTPALYASIHGGELQEAVRFDTSSIQEHSSAMTSIPNTLLPVPSIARNNVHTMPVRNFSLSGRGMSNGTTINGKTFNKTRIDFEFEKGDTEIWKVSNRSSSGGMMSRLPHTFHVHGIQFSVLSYNGGAVPLEMQGLKDTVLVLPDVELELLVTFDTYDGIYLYHCHLLEHEDVGMMGQLRIS